MEQKQDVFENMDPVNGYSYREPMARDIEKIIRKRWPKQVKMLEGDAWKLSPKGNYGKASREDFKCEVLSYLRNINASRWLGLGADIQLMQWQYKSFVKRAGPAVLEAACHSCNADRGAVIWSIFLNDWQTLDRLIRQYHLTAAVEMAIDSIVIKGATI